MMVNIPSWTVDFAVCGFWFLCGFVLCMFLIMSFEKDIIDFKIDEVLKRLKKIEQDTTVIKQDITLNNINETRKIHKNSIKIGEIWRN